MTNLNKKRNLIKAILATLDEIPYSELNKVFGSLTIKEMQSLKHEMHIDDVCEMFGITKAQYQKDVEGYEESYYIRKNESYDL